MLGVGCRGESKEAARRVTRLCACPGWPQVLTASFDGTARIHGLKSGKLLKEFRGHTSYVNAALWTTDGGSVLTASSDGTVRVWDSKTCTNTNTFTPPTSTGRDEVAVNDIHLLPATLGGGAEFLVCTRSPEAHLMNTQGQVTDNNRRRGPWWGGLGWGGVGWGGAPIRVPDASLRGPRAPVPGLR